MIDFSYETAKSFWQSKGYAAAWQVISLMETVEGWSLDGDATVEVSIDQLTAVMNQVGAEFNLVCEKDFIELLVSLKISRALYIMQTIDNLSPGSASKLLLNAELLLSRGNVNAEFFLNRNVVFERLQLSARIFSPTRLQLLKEIIEDGVKSGAA